jgi:hypothetical protein
MAMVIQNIGFFFRLATVDESPCSYSITAESFTFATFCRCVLRLTHSERLRHEPALVYGVFPYLSTGKG